MRPGAPELCRVEDGRLGYILALDGTIETNAGRLAEGEGVELHAGELRLSASSPCSALWIDLPERAQR